MKVGFYCHSHVAGPKEEWQWNPTFNEQIIYALSGKYYTKNTIGEESGI